MNSYALQAYKNVKVNTASNGDLIVMLFDGAIRFANQAINCIDESDIAGAHNKLVRAQDIMTELISVLNMDVGEIAQNLYQLYTFINQLLIQANVNKDPVLIQQAIKLLTELRDMWHEVVEQA